MSIRPANQLLFEAKVQEKPAGSRMRHMTALLLQVRGQYASSFDEFTYGYIRKYFGCVEVVFL